LDADVTVLSVQMFEDLECRDGCVAQAGNSSCVEESVGDGYDELGFQGGGSDALAVECFRDGKEEAVGLRDLCGCGLVKVVRIATRIFWWNKNSPVSIGCSVIGSGDGKCQVS
jgi:hypothetical protein